MDEWSIFPDKVPWIPSTPSTRTAKKNDQAEETVAKNEQMQQGPQLASNQLSEATLSPAEEKKLEHMRGLQEMGVDLPEQMQQQLETLVAKQQATLANRSLTHSHLNRLNRLKAQVTAAAKKLTELDAEWKSFMGVTLQKVKQHSEMYQQCRGDLLENYNAKVEELRRHKQEINAASQSLLGQQWSEPETIQQPPIAEQLDQLREIVDVEALEDHVDLTADMEDEETEDAIPSQMSGKTNNRPLKGFRAAQSPTKVATQHLKQKVKEKEEK